MDNSSSTNANESRNSATTKKLLRIRSPRENIPPPDPAAGRTRQPSTETPTSPISPREGEDDSQWLQVFQRRDKGEKGSPRVRVEDEAASFVAQSSSESVEENTSRKKKLKSASIRGAKSISGKFSKVTKGDPKGKKDRDSKGKPVKRRGSIGTTKHTSDSDSQKDSRRESGGDGEGVSMVAYPIAFLFHYMHSFVSKNKIFQNSPDEETPSYANLMGKKYKAGLPPEYKISHSGKGNSEVEYAPHLSIPFTSLEQQYLRGVPITTLAGKFGGYSPTIPEGLLVYLSSTMMDINHQVGKSFSALGVGMDKAVKAPKNVSQIDWAVSNLLKMWKMVNHVFSPLRNTCKCPTLSINSDLAFSWVFSRETEERSLVNAIPIHSQDNNASTYMNSLNNWIAQNVLNLHLDQLDASSAEGKCASAFTSLAIQRLFRVVLHIIHKHNLEFNQKVFADGPCNASQPPVASERPSAPTQLPPSATAETPICGVEVPSGSRSGRRRDRQIVEEILTSEATYASSLALVVQHLRYPLLEWSLTQKGVAKKREESVRAIFGNIGELAALHDSFLQRLKQRVSNWEKESKIADLFINLVPRLEMYNVYGNNYCDATDTLEEMEELKQFRDKLRQCMVEAQAAGTQLTELRSYLILPIQRLYRYILLLQSLHDHMGDTNAAEKEKILHAVQLLSVAGANLDKACDDARKRKRFQNTSSLMSVVEPYHNLSPKSFIVDQEGLVLVEPSMRPQRVCIALFSSFLLVLFVDVIEYLRKAEQDVQTAQMVPNLLSTKAGGNAESSNCPYVIIPTHLTWLVDGTSEDIPKQTELPPSYLNQESAPEICKLHGPRVSFTLILKGETKYTWMDQVHDLVSTSLRAYEHLLASVDALSSVRIGSVQFGEDVHYIGWWRNGRFSGLGRLLAHGTEYEGEFVDNMKCGRGMHKYNNGDVYIGEWSEDRPNGKGVITTTHGDTYDGEIQNGARHGHGTLHYANGDVYKGSWANNLPSGEGVFESRRGAFKYHGNWRFGLAHGEGLWEYFDGRRYRGGWSHGQREGQGEITISSQETTLLGSFEGNLLHGTGTIKIKTSLPHPSSQLEYHIYSGDVAQGKRHGRGVLRLVDGSVYEGEWENGSPNGAGTIVYDHGNIQQYEGMWDHGIFHGRGTLKFLNGQQLVGMWDRGKPHGKLTMTYPNGFAISTNCRSGRYDGDCSFTLQNSIRTGRVANHRDVSSWPYVELPCPELFGFQVYSFLE